MVVKGKVICGASLSGQESQTRHAVYDQASALLPSRQKAQGDEMCAVAEKLTRNESEMDDIAC